MGLASFNRMRKQQAEAKLKSDAEAPKAEVVKTTTAKKAGAKKAPAKTAEKE